MINLKQNNIISIHNDIIVNQKKEAVVIVVATFNYDVLDIDNYSKALSKALSLLPQDTILNTFNEHVGFKRKKTPRNFKSFLREQPILEKPKSVYCFHFKGLKPEEIRFYIIKFRYAIKSNVRGISLKVCKEKNLVNYHWLIMNSKIKS